NCHTIGTDYGEFGSTLSCPAGANVAEYKTTWFRVDIAGADTFDISTRLINSTNVSASQIKYRFMLGDCTAMLEQGCVNDANTTDTYECLVQGSYFIQVMTPVHTLGDVSLEIVATR